MKFRAHDTFFIRRGWLSKGLCNVDKDAEVFISKEKNPTDILGIGSNMVKALRYWMQAVGLTEEPKSGKRPQHFTEFGRIIFANDKYIEEMGTLFLLQYKLATNEEMVTAWNFFFNVFGMTEFTKENFVMALKNYLLEKNLELPADRSLEDDFNCIINTYARRQSNVRVSPEFNIDCPFRQLSLIEILNENKKIYKKTSPKISNLNPLVILAIILKNAGTKKEIQLNDLLNAAGNIGRVFNLDTVTMLEILYKIEQQGLIKINRTAGLDVINIQTELTPLECVKEYYKKINGQSLEN